MYYMVDLPASSTSAITFPFHLIGLFRLYFFLHSPFSQTLLPCRTTRIMMT